MTEPRDDDLEEQTPPGQRQAPPAAPPPPTLTLTPDMVRNSPEYRQLMEQNRTLARQKGDAETAAAAARADAEVARQAAEAQQRAALDTQLRETLGEEGIAFWSEFAELSSTDPVAAARRLAEFRSSGAQSAQPGNGGQGQPSPTQGARTVPAQGTGAPPPASSALGADAPLGSIPAADSDEQTIAALDETINRLIERNQSPLTRNRVTDRERNEGIMAIFAKGVVKEMAKRRNQPPR